MDEPIADAVQPEGQGGGGEQAGGGSPWADLLDRVPEEVRGDFESRFKEWDANYTRASQDAAEYRKGWEPYEQLGLNQRSPEEVQWALQLGQLAQQDPQAFQEWFQGYANEYGLTPQEAAQQQQQEQQPGLDEYFGITDGNQLQQLLEQQLSPLNQRLEQFEQRWQQQEQAAREAQAREFIDHQMQELKDKHLNDLPENLRDRFDQIVEAQASRYIESDPQHAIERGWADFQAVMNQLQTAALQDKANQPAPAETGGPAAVGSALPKTFKEAEAQAREMIRQSRAA